MLNIKLQKQLLTIARKSIKHGLEKETPLNVDIMQYSKELQEKRATFVTLHKDGSLRGCIGSLQAYRALIQDVAMNAYASAFNDYRFLQITQDEFKKIMIDISILTPRKEIKVADEKELLQKLRPNTDGLYIENSQYSATFLPSVWEELPDASLFLSHLKRKAGMDPNTWPEDIRCYTYQSEMIKET